MTNDTRFTLRRSEERGRARHGGWLDSRHTFSFGSYYDPDHMGFGALRVINDDRVAPGAGFPRHGHRDMEILSYVLDGALEHKDSIGNGSVIRPGDVQRMSAGTGVMHSEYNGSETEPVRFLQIWVLPEKAGIAPSYEEKHFGDERNGALRLVASRDGREGSLTVHQDLSLYASVLSAGDAVEHVVPEGRRAWVQVVKGAITVNGEALREGDAVSTETAQTLSLSANSDAELLLFDLAR